MDIEKIVNDSRTLAKRVHELEGAWDPCALITALCVNVGSLAETVMVLEHKRHPREGAPVQVERNIAGTLYALMELSTLYEIDLERAWNETIQGDGSNLPGWKTRRETRKASKRIEQGLSFSHVMRNEITIFQANRKENEHEKALGEGVDDPGWDL